MHEKDMRLDPNAAVRRQLLGKVSKFDPSCPRKSTDDLSTVVIENCVLVSVSVVQLRCNAVEVLARWLGKLLHVLNEELLRRVIARIRREILTEVVVVGQSRYLLRKAAILVNDAVACRLLLTGRDERHRCTLEQCIRAYSSVG